MRTRTSYLENAADDLSYLRSLAGNAPPARVYGFITSNWWDVRIGKKATAPLGGVPVHLESDKRAWRTTTDAAGVFDFTALPPGNLSLSADLPRKLGGGAARTISHHEHACSEQILVAMEQGELSGSLLDDRGDAVRTTVVMVPLEQGRPVSGFSEENGTFTIRHIGPGDYFLGVNISDPPHEGHRAHGAPWQPTYYPGVQDRASAQRSTSKVRSTCEDSNFASLLDLNRRRSTAW